MLKLFMNTTDNFLCNNLKSIFEKTEQSYKDRRMSIDLSKEFERLKLSALVSREGNSSHFEKSIKFKLKLLLGVFFVVVPLFSLILITYILGLEYSYAFTLTFAVAILGTIRMENIIHRYARKRCMKASC